MLTNEWKVLFDNGYLVLAIKSLKDFPLKLGSTVEVKVLDEGRDVREIFDKVLDEGTQSKMMTYIYNLYCKEQEAKEKLNEPKVSAK